MKNEETHKRYLNTYQLVKHNNQVTVTVDVNYQTMNL